MKRRLVHNNNNKYNKKQKWSNEKEISWLERTTARREKKKKISYSTWVNLRTRQVLPTPALPTSTTFITIWRLTFHDDNDVDVGGDVDVDVDIEKKNDENEFIS